MQVAITHLTSHTRPLTSLVTWDTLETVTFKSLTHSLMFELVVLTAPLSADVTLVHFPSMMPNITLTLATLDRKGVATRRFTERTGTRMFFCTFSGMTHEGLTEIAYRTDKFHACYCCSRVLHETVCSNSSALHSSTMRANGEFLYLPNRGNSMVSNRMTKVTKSTVFLFHSAFRAFHLKVTRDFWHISVG